MTVLKEERVTDGVYRLTLNRPESLNALSKELLREIVRAFEDAQGEYEVVVVEGAGRAFSAGADLDEAADDGEDVELFQEITRRAREFEGIVVGKFHGWVVGGAFEWSLSFDLRYAEPGTTFKMTESEIGVTVSNASTYLLPLTVGNGKARELIFTSREVSADEANDMGLLSGVYPEGELEEHVVDVATDIVENKSRRALALNKRALNAAHPVDGALDYETLVYEYGEELDDDIDW